MVKLGEFRGFDAIGLISAVAAVIKQIGAYAVILILQARKIINIMIICILCQLAPGLVKLIIGILAVIMLMRKAPIFIKLIACSKGLFIQVIYLIKIAAIPLQRIALLQRYS